MINFSCSHCGMKFKVKPEFAGRATRCPTCKHPLTVPLDSETLVKVSGHLHGVPSSLTQAGLGMAGVTLEYPAAERADQQSVRDLLAGRTRTGERYLVENEIARGGMGSVLRAVDCDIRREVAIKYMLDQNDPHKKTRFIEEAQITGQLEHPCIVPIHELGVDAEKRLFFTMKMVRGHSLGQVFDELRTNPKTAEKTYTLGRLVNAYVNVCNALEYAHARGVIHRDLKPANIMLGEFGEVYLMDWGLAKVLRGDSVSAAATVPVAIPAATVAASQSSGASSHSQTHKVATSREGEADLTQEGSILGTPMYMPPEQALGQVHLLDQRSDIYSLGAILYEMLALQPPVVKEGHFSAVLARVMRGEVLPPEQRQPERAQAGKIPRELSAIAMKALAKNQSDRYPSVEGLRRDIELFQEGRSVSARPDTFREAAWKLVKRNRAVSAVTTAAILLLTFVLVRSSWANYQERRKTEKAYQAYQDQVKGSVPAFVRSARLSFNEKDFDGALEQIDVAVKADPEHTLARLLRGEARIAKEQFAPAAEDLDKYLEQRPDDAATAQIRDLCRTSKPDDMPTLIAFYKAFRDDKRFVLADRMTHLTERLVKSRQELLVVYRQRIEVAWPGLGERLSLNADGRLSLYLFECKQVKDLTPLQGMKVNILDLSSCEVRDLTPLKGMPLTALHLRFCGQFRDLEPLKGMQLTELSLNGCGQLRDLEPLKGMPLTGLNLSHCTHVRDLEPLKGMPLTALQLRSCGQFRDLESLKGMQLTELGLGGCGQVRDLELLKGMPLKQLWIDQTAVTDLKPLEGMPLESINLTPKSITQGLDILRGMKTLKYISVANGGYPAAEFWDRYQKGEFKK